jgi:adenylate cyclase
VGLDLARTNIQITALLPMLETAIGTLVRHHLEFAQRSLDDLQNANEYDALPLAVGFVDIVDSTLLTRTLPPAQLTAVLANFEATMGDLVTARGGRLVKLIGDEAMFLHRHPNEAVDIALDAADAFARAEPKLDVRAGLAFGDVILRDGDGFGPVVNLAARLVKLAEPNGVILDEHLAALAQSIDGLAVVDPDEQQVKGFDEPVRYATAHRADPAR